MTAADGARQELTPEERLARLLKPTCPADYGLSVSLTELMSFKDGVEFIHDFIITEPACRDLPPCITDSISFYAIKEEAGEMQK